MRVLFLVTTFAPVEKTRSDLAEEAGTAGFGETSVSEKFEIYSRSFPGSNFVLPVYSSSQIFVFEVGVSLTVKDMTKSQF